MLVSFSLCSACCVCDWLASSMTGWLAGWQISKALLGSDDEEGGLTLLPSWIKEEDSLEVRGREG